MWQRRRHLALFTYLCRGFPDLPDQKKRTRETREEQKGITSKVPNKVLIGTGRSQYDGGGINNLQKARRTRRALFWSKKRRDRGKDEEKVQLLVTSLGNRPISMLTKVEGLKNKTMDPEGKAHVITQGTRRRIDQVQSIGKKKIFYRLLNLYYSSQLHSLCISFLLIN